MFFLKRNKLLLEKIDQYMEVCDSDMQIFEQAVDQYIKHGNSADFEALLLKAREFEGSADSILHNIQNSLYKKSLLPESRGDLMRLLERYDDIVDCTNHILRYLNTRNISIPTLISEDIKEIVSISLKCYEQVKKEIRDLLGKRHKVKGYVHTINNYESQCDDIQAKIIKEIFNSDVDKYDKILFTELINIIAKLTDYCEDAADHIMIINIKRVV